MLWLAFPLTLKLAYQFPIPCSLLVQMADVCAGGDHAPVPGRAVRLVRHLPPPVHGAGAGEETRIPSIWISTVRCVQVSPAPLDWSLEQTTWPMAIMIASGGLSAAALAKWTVRAGVRCRRVRSADP